MSIATVREETTDDLDGNQFIHCFKQRQYAAVLINTSQLEQISQNHEHLIVVVMASFWLYLLIASVYLARVSVKPLLESMQSRSPLLKMESRTENALAVLQKSFRDSFRKPEATIMESSESIASSLEEVRNMRFLDQSSQPCTSR